MLLEDDFMAVVNGALALQGLTGDQANGGGHNNLSQHSTMQVNSKGKSLRPMFSNERESRPMTGHHESKNHHQ
jgi:hypothetical protein